VARAKYLITVARQPERKGTKEMTKDEQEALKKDWRDDLFIMTCKTCGKQFTKYNEAVAHVNSHPKPDKSD
jgi:hypothetical protein